MRRFARILPLACAVIAFAVAPAVLTGQTPAQGAAPPPQQGGRGQFPGGTNPDGSLRPTAPVRALFSQDAYTQYEILEPGSESFRIKFLPETNRAGATEIVNETRGGSEGSGLEVYDPRTGKPLEFTYEPVPTQPDNHAIHAKLAHPVPDGGIGRVLIYKTYKDSRTYMMNGEDIVWVRSLSGYRLGVVLPPGFAFLSSNVAAQMSTLPDGRLRIAFANPSGESNPVTIHARKTAAKFTPSRLHRHVLRRREDALRSRRTGLASDRGHRDVQRLPQGRERDTRLARMAAAHRDEDRRPRHRRSAGAGKTWRDDLGQARRADHRRQAERAI